MRFLTVLQGIKTYFDFKTPSDPCLNEQKKQTIKEGKERKIKHPARGHPTLPKVELLRLGQVPEKNLKPYTIDYG